MNGGTRVNRKYIGIPVALIFMAAFVAISLLVNQSLHGTPWFLFSSGLRIVFGIAILYVAWRVYGKTIPEILNFKNSRIALISGIAFLVYALYFIMALIVGAESITGLTAGLLISKVILQQITTGFYEELNYRFLICEGYFHGERTIKRRLFYSVLSFLIFGVLHIINGWDTYRFLLTGSIGFAFATMFLCSGNIVIPMIIHALYDMIANLERFVIWRQNSAFDAINSALYIIIGVMVVLSVYMLIRKQKRNEVQH